MSEELSKTIIELVSKGGNTALVIYAISVMEELLRWIIGFMCLFQSVKAACNTAERISDAQREARQKN